MVAASVLILSYDRPELLKRSVASVLEQTVDDLEVLILGDGVTESVRASATELATHPRVRFLDYPKGPGRGELSRDRAIREAAGDAILYLCDDDLFMPTHVASMLALLETHSFAQSLNCWVDHEGALIPIPADLSSERAIAWHLGDDLQHNAVSITGTAHRRDFYLASGQPWEVTPAGYWPDHWQWRKLMRAPGFSAATAEHATALQFPHQLTPRADWDESRRAAELDEWMSLVRSPDGQARLDELVTRGALRLAEQMTYEMLQRSIDVGVLQGEIEAMRASISWRVTAPLRLVRSWSGRRR